MKRVVHMYRANLSFLPLYITILQNKTKFNWKNNPYATDDQERGETKLRETALVTPDDRLKNLLSRAVKKKIKAKLKKEH